MVNERRRQPAVVFRHYRVQIRRWGFQDISSLVDLGFVSLPCVIPCAIELLT